MIAIFLRRGYFIFDAAVNSKIELRQAETLIKINVIKLLTTIQESAIVQPSDETKHITTNTRR